MKLFKYLIFILITTSVYSSIDFAKKRCPEIKESQYIKNIYILEAGINCSTLDLYVDAIENLSKITPVKIPLLTFSISKYGDDASNKVEHIEIPETMIAYDHNGEFKLTKKLQINYLAHEYGHSIFNKLIEDRFLDLKNSLEKIQHFNELYFKLYNAEILNDSYEVELLTTRIDNEELDFYTNDKSLYPIMHILPYSELFSDLVSVLYSEDLQAFSKTFLREGSSASDHQKASYRDFSATHEIISWSITDRHSTFAPTRSFIGKHLNFPMTAAYKKQLLFELSTILLNQIHETLYKETLSSKSLNIMLIDKIKETNVFNK